MTHPGWRTARAAGVVEKDPEHPVPQRIGHRECQRRCRRRRILGRTLLSWPRSSWLPSWERSGSASTHCARTELRAAASRVQVLQDQVVAGNRATATAALASLRKHAATAPADTRGPHWSVAGAVLRFGADIRAVQTVSDVIDNLATDTLSALMDATSVDPLTFVPVGGRVNLAPLVKAAPQVVAPDTAVLRAVTRLSARDPDPLLAAVAAPLADLSTQVDKVSMTTATVARAVRLLPPMLGADGPRGYLLLVQDNAEQRATSGEVGRILRLRVVNGAVEIVEQPAAGGTVSGLPKSALPLPAEGQALFGDGLGIYMADVTFTPDFPRSGALARATWSQGGGGNVDGVLWIDPGAMAAAGRDGAQSSSLRWRPHRDQPHARHEARIIEIDRRIVPDSHLANVSLPGALAPSRIPIVPRQKDTRASRATSNTKPLRGSGLTE